MLSIFIILKVKKYLFYSFIIVCLLTLFSFNVMAFQKNAQQANISPKDTKITSLSYSFANSQPQQPTSLNSTNNQHLSAKSTVPVISLAVTKEEIALREEQIKIAQEHKRSIELGNQAGIRTYEEKLMAEYFVLSNKIRLLQAKQLLQLKQQQKENKNSLAKIQ